MSNKRQSSSHKDADKKAEREYEQQMVDLARVTRVMGGGKRMSFRACMVIGNRNGRVAYAVAKGPDVQVAIAKAVRLAEKKWLQVKMNQVGSIPHEVVMKYKSAKILLKPAPVGTGIKAGGAIRIVMDMAGLKNIVAKQFGSSNKINNVKAAFAALRSLREPRDNGRQAAQTQAVAKAPAAEVKPALRNNFIK